VRCDASTYDPVRFTPDIELRTALDRAGMVVCQADGSDRGIRWA